MKPKRVPEIPIAIMIQIGWSPTECPTIRGPVMCPSRNWMPTKVMITRKRPPTGSSIVSAKISAGMSEAKNPM